MFFFCLVCRFSSLLLLLLLFLIVFQMILYIQSLHIIPALIALLLYLSPKRRKANNKNERTNEQQSKQANEIMKRHITSYYNDFQRESIIIILKEWLIFIFLVCLCVWYWKQQTIKIKCVLKHLYRKLFIVFSFFGSQRQRLCLYMCVGKRLKY